MKYVKISRTNVTICLIYNIDAYSDSRNNIKNNLL